VFFITGLWHGASWNFIIWGLFHGLFLMIERLGFDKILNRMPKIIGHIYTLLIVMIGWVFFRNEDLDKCILVIQKMFYFNTDNTGIYTIGYYMHLKTWITMFVGILFAFPIHRFVFPSFQLKRTIPYDIVYFGLFILSLLVLSASTYNPFIYYRF
jgi:alginate O-acetyltransferase complex protein AlgI